MIDPDFIIQLSTESAVAQTESKYVTDENAGRVFKKQVVYAGEFLKGDQEIPITNEDIDHWEMSITHQVENGVRIDVPNEHKFEPDDSRGKVLGAESGEDAKGRYSLFAFIEFAPDHVKLANTAEVSIYAPASYQDGKGRVYSRPIRHVALTQDPVIPDMDSFTLLLSKSKVTAMSELHSLAKAAGIETDGLDDKAIASKLKARLTAKPTEPKKKTTSPEDKTLSLDPTLLKAHVPPIVFSRKQRLDSLEKARKCTPAMRKKLEEQHCTDEAVLCALSSEDTEAFDKAIEVLELGQPSALGDGSEESQVQVLELSNEQLVSKKDNPLVAACSEM